MLQDLRGKTKTQKIAASALLAAIAISLSGFSIPVGPSKCFPIQHTINAIAGVTLGPWWALGSALAASTVRNIIGTGTLLAFPGSIFGALAVGFAANSLPARHRNFAALCEPIAASTLGAWVSSLLLASPSALGASYSFLALAFFTSSFTGACLGFSILHIEGYLRLGSRGKTRKDVV